MKRWLFGLLLTATTAQAAPLGIMVPAYFYPGSLWNSMNYAAGRVPLVAIMNPNSGPDTTQNPDYVAAVNSLRATGGKVIGYVYTSYAGRSNNVVQTDIDRYFSFYTVDGIFLDEVTNDADTNHLNYYAALYQYIKAKGTNLLVVTNPGTQTEEAYLTRPTTDVVCTFEDDAGYGTYIPSNWTTNHLARRFYHLPYNTTNATTMTNYVNLAISRNVGWIYLTNDKGGNPWDTLPSYWTNEVEYVRSLNLSAPGTRLSLIGMTDGITKLSLTGATGTYEIQGTSNFSSWFPVRTVNTQTGAANFTDPTATNHALRYYRTTQ